MLRSLTLLRRLSLDAALVDETQGTIPAAKTDVLLQDLGELVGEGHQALVFSQFTTFLSRIRTRLAEAEIPYAYLDGRTRNRERVIQRFRDKTASVFLISLKAGGFGLNLAEADYCFVLDPWWNPAIEAQAVDRTHRIGQTKTVMVYRLVAKDTIEQKVMDLKAQKEELFSAVVGGEALAGAALTAFAELVHARLGLLTDEQRRVLSALALIGGEPDWSLAAVVTDLDEQSVWSAARAARRRLICSSRKKTGCAGGTRSPERRWRPECCLRSGRLSPYARRGHCWPAAERTMSRLSGPLGGCRRPRGSGGDSASASRTRHDERGDAQRRTAPGPVGRGSCSASPGGDGTRTALTLIGDASRALEVGATALDLSTGDDHAELCLRLARAAIIARRWKRDRRVRRPGRPAKRRAILSAAR